MDTKDMSPPVLQAYIEGLPEHRWKDQLSYIEDEKLRARVKDHLTTVWKLRRLNR